MRTSIAYRSPRRTWLALGILVVVVLALVAVYWLTQDNDDSDDDVTRVTLFMSYIPSVQFSHVYVAAEKGYFADEGIEIAFENSFNEADGVERIASGDLQFGLISGEQVIMARGQGRPLVYVYEWYHNFPVGVVAPADSGIDSPDDLADHVVGIPGPQGASYIGLRALLGAGGITEDDLGELRSIGFTAPESICAGEVEAAVVYVANEPLTIEQQCMDVNVIAVSDYATLVSNGLVTNEETVRNNPELVEGMVRAIRRGTADVIADPDAAFDLVVKDYVPDLAEAQYDTQRQVLRNSVEIWRSDDLGRTDLGRWQDTQAILLTIGLLDEPLENLEACFDMGFLPDESS